MATFYEFDQIITSDCEVIYLRDYRDRFSWDFRGRGMPPKANRTERGPFQHGDTLLGYVLRPRTISLVVRRNNCSRQEYWDARAELLDAIRPNRHREEFDVATLRKILPNGEKRDIDVIIDRGPDFTEEKEGKWDEFSYQEALRFTAFDPIFYDPDIKVVSYALSDSDDQLSFSITFPIEFGPAESIPLFSIPYSGSWESYPDIVLIGPMNSPVIRNITTKEEIRLNYDIPAARTVTINLKYGNKTIEDDLGNNLIGLIESDSDLSTFKLATTPLATDGINEIGFSADGVTSSSEIIIRYLNKYIGI